jgi:hypothetical protein
VTKAARTLDAPGMGVIWMFSSIALFMSVYAGSEIPGVPASDTNATSFPSFNRSVIFSNLLWPEYEWKLKVGVLISYFLRRIDVWRVSSAAITSASFSVRIARRVMSSRFPIGVETMYNILAWVLKFQDLLYIRV